MVFNSWGDHIVRELVLTKPPEQQVDATSESIHTDMAP
jgi:hypothetical protein